MKIFGRIIDRLLFALVRRRLDASPEFTNRFMTALAAAIVKDALANGDPKAARTKMAWLQFRLEAEGQYILLDGESATHFQ
jgi:hypothetical protein